MSLANAAIGLADLDSDDPQSVGDYLAVLLFSTALLGAAVASVFLRRSGADRSRRAWSLGLAVAVAGGALAGLGGLALVVGLLTAGGSVLVAAPPWRWVGVGLVLVAIGIAIGEQAGFAVAGLTWIALAFLFGGRTRHFRPAGNSIERGA